jgi:hypothetical protein
MSSDRMSVSTDDRIRNGTRWAVSQRGSASQPLRRPIASAAMPCQGRVPDRTCRRRVHPTRPPAADSGHALQAGSASRPADECRPGSSRRLWRRSEQYQVKKLTPPMSNCPTLNAARRANDRGRAIKYRLSQAWSVVPSTAAVSADQGLAAPKGHNRPFAS